MRSNRTVVVYIIVFFFYFRPPFNESVIVDVVAAMMFVIAGRCTAYKPVDGWMYVVKEWRLGLSVCSTALQKKSPSFKAYEVAEALYRVIFILEVFTLLFIYL